MCFGVALPPAAAAFRGPPPGLPRPRAPSGSTAFLSLHAPNSCLGASACPGSPCIRNPRRCRPHPRTVARAPRSSLWSPCHPEILSFTSSFRPASSCLPPAAPRRRVPCQVNEGGVRGPGVGGGAERDHEQRSRDGPECGSAWMDALAEQAPASDPRSPRSSWWRPRSPSESPRPPDSRPSDRVAGTHLCQAPAALQEASAGLRAEWAGRRGSEVRGTSPAAACGLTASTQEAAATVGPWAPRTGLQPRGAGCLQLRSPCPGQGSPAQPGLAQPGTHGGGAERWVPPRDRQLLNLEAASSALEAGSALSQQPWGLSGIPSANAGAVGGRRGLLWGAAVMRPAGEWAPSTPLPPA